MITIRPARKTDYPRLVNIFRELARAEGYNGWFPRVVFDDFIDRAHEEGTAHPRFHIKVAVNAATGAIAGFVRATHRLDGQTTINESFRTPAYRSAGINELLYADVEKSAAARGNAVVFTKLVDCRQARHFAEKAGYTAIGLQTPDRRLPAMKDRSAVILFAKAAQPGQTLESCRDKIHTNKPRNYTETLKI